MPFIDTIKEKVEKITGWGRPTRREVDAELRPRKPNVLRFADDGAWRFGVMARRARSCART